MLPSFLLASRSAMPGRSRGQKCKWTIRAAGHVAGRRAAGAAAWAVV